MTKLMACWVVIGWLALLLLQVLAISQAVDAYGLVLHADATGWLALFAYFGAVAKWAVLCGVIVLLLIGPRLPSYWQKLLLELRWQQLGFYGALEFIGFGCFVYFSVVIFKDPNTAHLLSAMPFVLWLVTGFLTLIFWLLALVCWRQLWRLWCIEWRLLIAAAGLALAVLLLTFASSTLWGTLAELTFNVASFWLNLFSGDAVYMDPDAKILGLNDFNVHVANACSGYEGIGLVLAFTGIYLWVYRHEFRFPAALILFPVGAFLIWMLNTLRIAVLILIGAYGSPEVAVGGFHSQAGWITFIATSVFMLWLAGKSARLSSAVPVNFNINESAKELSQTSLNQAIAALMPIVALLAVMLITSVFSASWDAFYPLRVIAVVVALWWGCSLLTSDALKASARNKKMWLEAIVLGLVVAVVWVLLIGPTPEANEKMASGLSAQAPLWATIWLVFRFVGAIVTVPIAEELAFRGYLLCQFSRSEAYVVGKIPMVWLAVIVSSLAFGALHGAWVAGALAGLVYTALRLRYPTIIAPIIAHASTNAALAIYAASSGHWGVM